MEANECWALITVLFGAFTQAITGTGFASICAPFLILSVGTTQGVPLVIALCVPLNLMVIMREWRHVSIKHVVTLWIPAALVVPLGSWIAGAVPESTALIVAGSLVLVAVSLAASGKRLYKLRGTSGAAVAGGASGLMGTLAGVASAPVALYVTNADWDVNYPSDLERVFLGNERCHLVGARRSVSK